MNGSPSVDLDAPAKIATRSIRPQRGERKGLAVEQVAVGRAKPDEPSQPPQRQMKAPNAQQ